MWRSERLVDDFVSLVPLVSDAVRIKDDLSKTFSEFGFSVKQFYHTGQHCEPGEETVQVLGVDWNLKTDYVTVRTKLYPGGKRRGALVGGPLSADNIPTMPVTKEILSRFAGMVFCYSGAFLGPAQA